MYIWHMERWNGFIAQTREPSSTQLFNRQNNESLHDNDDFHKKIVHYKRFAFEMIFYSFSNPTGTHRSSPNLTPLPCNPIPSRLSTNIAQYSIHYTQPKKTATQKRHDHSPKNAHLSFFHIPDLPKHPKSHSIVRAFLLFHFSFLPVCSCHIRRFIPSIVSHVIVRTAISSDMRTRLVLAVSSSSTSAIE